MTTELRQENDVESAPADAVSDGRGAAVRRSGLVVMLVAALLLAGVGGLGALALRGNVIVPELLVSEVRTALDAELDIALGRQVDTEIGSIAVSLTRAGRPSIAVTDLTVRATGSGESVSLPRLEFALNRRALLRGDLRPEEVTLEGARLRLSRDETGILRVASQMGAPVAEVPSVQALLAQIEGVFELPGLTTLDRIVLSDLSLDIADSRFRKVIPLRGGAISVENARTHIAISLETGLPSAAGGAGAELRLITRKGDPEADLLVRLDAVPSQILAQQSESFAALEKFDGPLSARLVGGLDASGKVTGLAGQVSAGEGVLALGGKLPDMLVSGASAQWHFDGQQGRVSLKDIQAETDRARFVGDGFAEVIPATGDAAQLQLPDVLLNLDLQDVWVNADPFLDSPQTLSRVLLNGRWRWQTRQLDLGQVMVEDSAAPVIWHGNGRLSFPQNGPKSGLLELQTSEVSAGRILDFWPRVGRAARPGAWLGRSLAGGVLTDVSSALTFVEGNRPKLEASFAFKDADLTVRPSLPPLNGRSGHGQLFNHVLTIVLEDGTVQPPNAEPIDLAGTTFQVRDTRVRGGPGHLNIEASGSVESTLAFLALPPINLLEKARLPAARLSGVVQGSASLEVPLRKGVKVDMATLQIDADLPGLRLSDAAPGLDFQAGDLRLAIADQSLSLQGEGTLAEVPVTVALNRSIVPAADGLPLPTRISGDVAVTPQGLERLGVRLMPGMLAGAGSASYELTLLRDTAPTLRVESDLAGMRLSVPSLAWSKSTAQTASLAVDATLGPVPEVTRLSLDGPGLDASGRIRLRPNGGGIDVMTLDRLRVGRWLDAEGTLTGRGRGQAPQVRVSSGWLDLRSLPQGLGASNRNSGQIPPTLQVRLDRLIVSDRVTLTQLQGNLRPTGVLNGTVSGRLNGGEPIKVRLSQSSRGTQAAEITSSDAGAVLRDSGTLRNLQGGDIRIALDVRPGARPGIIDGSLDIANGRLIETPGAMQFVSGLSIVGLLDQLANGGVAFADISTGFSLSPDGVTLREGRAVGPALGITFAGTVQPEINRIAMQGVVSPLYLINMIPGALVARRGEGLIGINYSVSGAMSAPRVSVNPLSFLTPGAFRDLFRRAPPDLTQ